MVRKELRGRKRQKGDWKQFPRGLAFQAKEFALILLGAWEIFFKQESNAIRFE